MARSRSTLGRAGEPAESLHPAWQRIQLEDGYTTMCDLRICVRRLVEVHILLHVPCSPVHVLAQSQAPAHKQPTVKHLLIGLLVGYTALQQQQQPVLEISTAAAACLAL
jgi:hypothetical protein